MRNLLFLSFFYSFILGVEAQITSLDDSNAYDYYIVGESKPELKTLPEIARFYGIDMLDLVRINTQYGRYDDIWEYCIYNLCDSIPLFDGQVILLAPFTHRPIEINFDRYFKTLLENKNDTLLLHTNSQENISLNKQVIGKISLIHQYCKQCCKQIDDHINFEPNFFPDFLYAEGKIILNRDIVLYIVTFTDAPLRWQKCMYVTYKERLIAPPILIAYSSNQNNGYAHSKIFYNEGKLYILITTIRDDEWSYTYTHKKISLYRIPQSISFEKEILMLETNIKEKVLYEHYEDLLLLDALKIKR